MTRKRRADVEAIQIRVEALRVEQRKLAHDEGEQIPLPFAVDELIDPRAVRVCARRRGWVQP